MGQWLYHWIYIDGWCPIWPNLAASLIVYVFVFLKMRSMTELHKEQVKLHDELKVMQSRHHKEHMQMLTEIKAQSDSN